MRWYYTFHIYLPAVRLLLAQSDLPVISLSYAGHPVPHHYFIASSDETVLTEMELQLHDDEPLRRLVWEKIMLLTAPMSSPVIGNARVLVKVFFIH